MNEILFTKEELEDTKCVIRIRKRKKQTIQWQKVKVQKTQNDPQCMQIKLKIE